MHVYLCMCVCLRYVALVSRAISVFTMCIVYQKTNANLCKFIIFRKHFVPNFAFGFQYMSFVVVSVEVFVFFCSHHISIWIYIFRNKRRGRWKRYLEMPFYRIEHNYFFFFRSTFMLLLLLLLFVLSSFSPSSSSSSPSLPFYRSLLYLVWIFYVFSFEHTFSIVSKYYSISYWVCSFTKRFYSLWISIFCKGRTWVFLRSISKCYV